MSLTDTALRAAKPRLTPYKLTDSAGLYLLIRPSGSKLWRLDYAFLGKRNTLALGSYPMIGLAEARRERDKAKELITRNTDPSTQRKLDRIAAQAAASNTFSKPRLLELRESLSVVLAILALTCVAASSARADESEKSWRDLRETLFGSRPIEDGGALLSLAAPAHADDPALVPVEIGDLRAGETANRIRALTLIVDENPAPVAAVFSMNPDARVSTLETRIRVNAYSFLRVIAETEDGALHMVKRYVKATGGCAAPATKNAGEAIASLGQMRLRHYPATDGQTDVGEVQLQIRHPNYSGLQMDQVTGLYRAAHFVSGIRITADGKPVMSVEGAISLSENPSLRFKYRPNGGRTLSARVEDTEGNVFEQSWEAVGFPSD